MCQFPAEKPCLRPPNFLTRGLGGQSSRHHGHGGHRRRSNFQPRVPVTMEDLDVYFESLRNVSSNSHSGIFSYIEISSYELFLPTAGQKI